MVSKIRAICYIKYYKILFIVVFLLMSVQIGFQVYQPLLYGKVIDYILQKNLKQVWHTILMIVGLIFGNACFTLLKAYLNHLLCNKIILDIKCDLYHHILHFPVKNFDQLRVGEIISRLEGDVNTLSTQPILKDIVFTARPGQIMALVGASGSGKTTLFNLLMRFLRNHLAIVSQEPFLFNMSIKENLFLANPEATMEELIYAAKKAYIHHFIINLRNGYDTVLGECGTGLSGGQKQRLAIVRAILRGAKILLLDEATSALDGESEEYIQKTLQNLCSDHIIIVIAHRLSTVINVHQIVVLSKGQVVGIGNHEDLIKSNETYKRLFLPQYQRLIQTIFPEKGESKEEMIVE